MSNDEPGWIAIGFATILFSGIMAWGFYATCGAFARISCLAYSWTSWCFCCCGMRTKGCLASRCKKARALAPFGRKYPYCADHMKNRARRKDPVNSESFVHGYYTHNERFPDSSKSLESILAEYALRPPSSPAGYNYVFVSTYDLAHRLTTLHHLTSSEKFFYKVGMTSAKSAYGRVAQQKGAVFPSGSFFGKNGVDYVSTKHALDSETLAHAALTDVRYRRYAHDTESFQIEWFMTSREKVIDTMKRASRAVDQSGFTMEDWNRPFATSTQRLARF